MNILERGFFMMVMIFADKIFYHNKIITIIKNLRSILTCRQLKTNLRKFAL